MDGDDLKELACLQERYDALYEQVLERAAGPENDALRAAERSVDRIDELWEADKLAYRAAYLAVARQLLTDRGLDELAVELADPTPAGPWASDELTEELREHARRTTGSTPTRTSRRPMLNMLASLGEHERD